MNLKERINKIASYFRGIEFQGGLIIVKVDFPPKITPSDSDDGLIKVTFSEDDNLWYYYADAELIDENSIFDMIEETVNVYEEAKAKVVLMKEKIEELRELFATKPLVDLELLYFDFKQPISEEKPKTKRKYTKRIKVSENENIEDINERTEQNLQ